MNRGLLIAVLVLAIIVAVAYGLYRGEKAQAPRGAEGRAATGTSGEIVVCNAGSLTIPLKQLASIFEERYGVRVVLEPSGSVMAVRKVTDLGKNCDVVAVADYRLIPMFMVPKYARWYVAFASNSMVIVYRHGAEPPRDLHSLLELWARGEARYGFSNPNMDPCGYRAVGVIGLAALYYNDTSILERLIISRIPGSTYKIMNGTLHIYIPASFEARSPLVVRPKSVDLIALLEAGELDYAFEYRSVAVQHNLSFVELPPQLNLASLAHESFYSRVVVHILVGTDKEKEITMAPIVYGVTVPVNAEHPREALEFVRLLLSNTGREVFERLGQSFLEKPLGFGQVPDELRGLVRLEGS